MIATKCVEWNPRSIGSGTGPMRHKLLFPSDLRSLVEEAKLVRLVLESVRDMTVNGSADGCCGLNANGIPSAILLALMTYSYATGCFGSADVADEVRRDDLLRCLATDHRPQDSDLRQFRRRCRAELRRCLGEVLRRVPDPGLVHECPKRPPPGRCCVPPAKPSSFSQGDDRFEAEAEARIALAVQTDSLAMDE